MRYFPDEILDLDSSIDVLKINEKIEGLVSVWLIGRSRLLKSVSSMLSHPSQTFGSGTHELYSNQNMSGSLQKKGSTASDLVALTNTL
jgi:hypothetical protein